MSISARHEKGSRRAVFPLFQTAKLETTDESARFHDHLLCAPDVGRSLLRHQQSTWMVVENIDDRWTGAVASVVALQRMNDMDMAHVAVPEPLSSFVTRP